MRVIIIGNIELSVGTLTIQCYLFEEKGRFLSIKFMEQTNRLSFCLIAPAKEGRGRRREPSLPVLRFYLSNDVHEPSTRQRSMAQ